MKLSREVNSGFGAEHVSMTGLWFCFQATKETNQPSTTLEPVETCLGQNSQRPFITGCDDAWDEVDFTLSRDALTGVQWRPVQGGLVATRQSLSDLTKCHVYGDSNTGMSHSKLTCCLQNPSMSHVSLKDLNEWKENKQNQAVHL